MGAWGYGYKDNDDYYNEGPDFVQPLIKGLEEQLKVQKSDCFDSDGKILPGYGSEIIFSSFRSRLIWTYKVLSATDELVSFIESDIQVFKDSIKLIEDSLEDAEPDARNPQEFRTVVSAELDAVKEWLAGFGRQGFLEDRLPSIIEATGK